MKLKMDFRLNEILTDEVSAIHALVYNRLTRVAHLDDLTKDAYKDWFDVDDALEIFRSRSPYKHQRDLMHNLLNDAVIELSHYRYIKIRGGLEDFQKWEYQMLFFDVGQRWRASCIQRDLPQNFTKDPCHRVPDSIYESPSYRRKWRFELSEEENEVDQ